MNKVLLILLPFLMYHATLSGQNDPRAVKILDSFASNASKAPSVSMGFTMITRDLTENTADSVTGTVILSKDKYKLVLGDNMVWFNGETTWNYLPAEKEVTITKPDKKDHSFQNHPSDIFTMYKSGYKSRLIEENNSSWTVDLYPADMKSDLIRVRLIIRKNDMSLISFEYKRRDGIEVFLRISGYDLKQKPGAGTFVFPQDQYRDADINDMR
jgi:outer membrane lipoprotein-sorting protein